MVSMLQAKNPKSLTKGDLSLGELNQPEAPVDVDDTV